MLAIVEPDDLDEVLAICARWEVRATVVGRGAPASGRLRILDGRDGDVLADVPASSLHDAAPLYDRALRAAATAAPRRDPARARQRRRDVGADLLAMLADTGWVWRQYDHMLFLNTVAGPGGDATVLRLKHPVTGAGHRPGAGAHDRRQPPLVRRRPARRHGAASWPRRCSTWPASAPARSPSSTA